MASDRKYVLAMYDVRGIQNYIFRTPDLKSAIGASALIEDIIEKALREAIALFEKKTGYVLMKDMEWYEETGPKPYEEDKYDVQILYIGGGNAFVIYRNELECGTESDDGKKTTGFLAASINSYMAKYVIEHTYALQLAAAMVTKTENYLEDQQNVRRKMEEVKQKMSAAVPFGATPVVKIDDRTGYPLVYAGGQYGFSTESLNKKRAAEEKRWYYSEEEKKIDSLRTKKGVDSNVAVIHIDGNNLGLRIRALLKDKVTYREGVAAQRQISYRINHSYKTAFENMKLQVEEAGKNSHQLAMKETDIFIIPVVTAGDDITYVCNGKTALKSVEFFVKEISKYAMADNNADGKYSFSVCAGIAFVNSHFPFHIAYSVAEECCENAKKTAKSRENMQDNQIGNWVDYHICRNVHARNLKALREREYVTGLGEQLMTRPYYISTGLEREGGRFASLSNSSRALHKLEENILYFVEGDDFTKRFAKQLRNTYPMGRHEVQQLKIFLQSRKKKMPDGTLDMYEDNRARWYDALEIMDLFVPL